MAINTAARATLINDGGILDQLFAIGGAGKVELLRCVSERYRVQWTNVVQYARERGVDDPDKLPGYYYRDDGTKIWNVVNKFVEGIVDEFYSTDEDVKNDTEIQDWAMDVYTNAFPGWSGAKESDSHGFPREITTKNVLTEYCTLIIFTGSVQHASINFGQYDMYAFVPNAPATLRLPPPSKKGDADYNTLMSTLPDKTSTARQIAIAHLLSQYSDDEVSTYFGMQHTRSCPLVLYGIFSWQLN
jgi:arachidonate 5-lipoxygenase